MNKEEFSGNWKLVKGRVKERWERLSDDDIAKIEGKRDQLLGLLEKRYGYGRERAEQELESWEDEIELEEEEFPRFFRQSR